MWLPFDEAKWNDHAEITWEVAPTEWQLMMNGAVFTTDEAKFGPSSLRVPISSANARVLNCRLRLHLGMEGRPIHIQ